jgi:5'-methylthioadenosine phosphorylase
VTEPRAEIGVLGGSGFYEFLEHTRSIEVETPYGPPAGPITIGTVGDRTVGFLPRHGVDHRFPPHKVPYRANLWAMKELGVTRVFGPCATGSLRREIPPGTLVVCDQAIDFTRGRTNTFFDGPEAVHASLADPYCPTLREHLTKAAASQGIEHRDTGTMVVIEGPRYSTRAESKMFAQLGADVIGMTQFPEVTLARELGLCFGTVALATDYDVGVDGIPPVSHEQVLKVFGENIDKLRDLLFATIPEVPEERTCDCGALAGTGDAG